MTDDYSRLTLTMPAGMKLAIQRTAGALNMDMSEWCRDALQAYLHEHGTIATWEPLERRGGYRRKQEDACN